MKDEGGLSRLLPNDEPVIGNVQMDVPNLFTTALDCATFLPTQSAELCEHGNVTFLHINARSLHQSHSEIVSLVHGKKQNAGFILISETWLDPKLTASYDISGYEMVHSIPDNCITGKGCAIYIKNNYFLSAKFWTAFVGGGYQSIQDA